MNVKLVIEYLAIYYNEFIYFSKFIYYGELNDMYKNDSDYIGLYGKMGYFYEFFDVDVLIEGNKVNEGW